MARTIHRDTDSFLRAVLKLIPSELVAVFIFLQGVLPAHLLPHLLVSAALLALTPFYLRHAVGVTWRPQIVLSSVSLLVWMYAMWAGPFRFLRSPWYEPWYGSVVLAFWTLIPPMFLYRGRSGEGRRSDGLLRKRTLSR